MNESIVNQKHMSQHYHTLSIKQIKEQTTEYEPLVDMVSYAEINPTGRNHISYLRLVNQIPTTMVYWDTASCINTFILQPTRRYLHGKNHIVDPETNQPIHPGFMERIHLYNDSLQMLGKDFQPDEGQVNAIFQQYLMDEVSERDKMILRSFLFLEDTDVLVTFQATGKDIRKEAEQRLKERGHGSYLLRTSSVVDSELVKAKVLSFNDNGTINHSMCIHAKGYGYFAPTGITQEQVMPSLTGEDRSVVLPLPLNGIVYACFLDWFETCCKGYNLVRSLYTV